ncbi:hypothetical protein IPP75_01850 [Candidatus Saccharibacteria bacterium]|nr:MAG: hypothetical protein IPP75_01850 [Candidatus Saccharibacteria bacterium]
MTTSLITADPVPQPTTLTLSWGGITAWSLFVGLFVVFLLYSWKGREPARSHAAWAWKVQILTFLLVGFVVGVVLPWWNNRR